MQMRPWRPWRPNVHTEFCSMQPGHDTTSALQRLAPCVGPRETRSDHQPATDNPTTSVCGWEPTLNPLSSWLGERRTSSQTRNQSHTERVFVNVYPLFSLLDVRCTCVYVQYIKKLCIMILSMDLQLPLTHTAVRKWTEADNVIASNPTRCEMRRLFHGCCTMCNAHCTSFERCCIYQLMQEMCLEYVASTWSIKRKAKTDKKASNNCVIIEMSIRKLQKSLCSTIKYDQKPQKIL